MGWNPLKGGIYGIGYKETERVYKKIIKDPELTALIGGVRVSSAISEFQTPPPIPPMPPTSRLGPAPRAVMAFERAMTTAQLRKRRRRLTVMGGDYGTLTTTTPKLGT